MSLIIKCKFIHISLVFTRALFLFQDTYHIIFSYHHISFGSFGSDGFSDFPCFDELCSLEGYSSGVFMVSVL